MSYKNTVASCSAFIVFFICNIAVAAEWNTIGSGEKVKTCAEYNKECSEKVELRDGEVSINTKSEYGFQLYVNGKPIADFEGYSLSIQETNIVNDNEIILLALNSGGMACPMEMYIVEISKTSNAISEAFGSCTDYYRTYTDKNVFVVRMPFYFNPMHLQDLSEKEREKIKNTGDTEFRWSNSKITEIHDVKKR